MAGRLQDNPPPTLKPTDYLATEVVGTGRWFQVVPFPSESASQLVGALSTDPVKVTLIRHRSQYPPVLDLAGIPQRLLHCVCSP